MPIVRARSVRTRSVRALAALLGAGLLGAGLVAVAPLAPAAAGASPPGASAAAVTAERDTRDPVVHPEVIRRMQGREKDAGAPVRVVVSLEAGGQATPGPRAIRSVRQEVLAALPATSYDVVQSFSRIPAVSLEVTGAAVDALAASPRVSAVNLDHTVELEMAQANAITGADQVHASGITGDGVTAAIIDSGVDSNAGVVHPALADDLAGQACFRTENDCIGGAGSAEDQNGHGTHVAGIITGPQGAAPDARFYALKVFTTGNTSDTNILNALNHAITLNTTTPGEVDVVNMSLGGASYGDQASCDAANTAYVNAFAALNAQDTTVFVATGNDALTSAVGAPACVTGAVGVGSTGDGNHNISFSSCSDAGAPDKVSCYSNATPVQGPGELVDLLAPGCTITSTWLDGGTNTICGTSMATPYAAGVAALVLDYADEAAVSLSPTDLETLLEETGVQLPDYRLAAGSPTFPRVAALDAIGALAVGTPSGLQVTGTTPTSVSLSWTGAAGAVGYRVFRTSRDEDDVLVGSPSGTTYTDTTVACGPVSYVVRAFDGSVVSRATNRVDATARACPAAPTGLALERLGPDSQRLTWSDPNPDETGVVLQRRRVDQEFTDHQSFPAGSSFSYDDTTAGCGLVEYRAVTVRGDDRSAPSDVVRRSICAPANDDRADAENVPVGSVGSTQTDTESHVPHATAEAGDPVFSCKFGGPGPGYQGIWYRIAPAANSRVTVSTATSTLIDPSSGVPDTILAVYRGAPSAANEVACNDDISGADLRSRATVNLKGGDEYYVHVAQWSEIPETATGTVSTQFSWLEPLVLPANDEWEEAAPIAPTPYSLEVANAQFATVSGSDPAHPCAYQGPRVGSHTLWWTFTPEVDGTLDLDTLQSTGSFTDTILSVWTGTPGSFANVACNDDKGSPQLRSELVDVPVEAGTTYSVEVSRWSTTPTATAGTVKLVADFAVDPAVLVAPTAVAVDEDGGTDTYDVRLATSPSADVTVTATPDAQCAVDETTLTFTAADWDQPQTVTVSAADDGVDEDEHTCTIGHAVSSADASYDGLAAPDVTATVTDALVTGQADARIRKGGGTLLGDDVYGTATGQTATAKVKRGRSVTFVASLQNDADVADALTVAGARGTRALKVVYRAPDGTNVTSQVLAGTLETPQLAPGETYDLKVTVTVARSARKGASLTRTVTAASVAAPAADDTVTFVVRRR